MSEDYGAIVREALQAARIEHRATCDEHPCPAYEFWYKADLALENLISERDDFERIAELREAEVMKLREYQQRAKVIY